MAVGSQWQLIELVSRLVNDAGLATWSESEIAAALDNNRVELRYVALDAVRSVAPGGIASYLTFDAPADYSHFDTDTAIYDSTYTALSPTLADVIRGRWIVATEPTRPVYVRGYSYDIYGAAADLLEERGAMLSEGPDSYAGHNGSLTFGGQRNGPLELAMRYRARSRRAMQVGTLYRPDNEVWIV